MMPIRWLGKAFGVPIKGTHCQIPHNHPIWRYM
jgi:hypothetical protein